jgi:hypothetical protein
MKENNTAPAHIARVRHDLGRMTEDEYISMWNGSHTKRSKDLRRLTDEEYRNLPYGNKGFYEQFKK